METRLKVIRTRTSTKTAARLFTSCFSLFRLYSSFVSFLVCVKVRDLKKIETSTARSTKIEVVHTLLFTFSRKPQHRFSLSVSKDDDVEVTRWLHSHVKSSYSVIKSVVL